jgi:hypothetical protein
VRKRRKERRRLPLLQITSSHSRFISSQNVALIQYKVPLSGQGFAFRVRHLKNEKREEQTEDEITGPASSDIYFSACNILMAGQSGTFTLSNGGEAKNCTLTTLLFPANFEILRSTMSGISSGEEGPEAPVR